jgi:hypothetical protein
MSGFIPLIRVAGDHRDVGRQVGEATAEIIRRAVDFDHQLPNGRTRDQQIGIAAAHRAVTQASTPWLVDEIDGAAEAAGVDPVALFAASIEEIWAERPSQAGTHAGSGRCSDLVAGPPATADGHLWVGHNNDLSDAEADVVAIEWRVPGEPLVFSLGIGPWISVGWNDAGLSLTGNELTPTDDRVGVPRLLMVRQQLTARTLEEAVTMAVRPDRASSYNTIFADRSGRVVNVEGSATDDEAWGLDERGTLAHTNHYLHPRMLRFEGDPAYAAGSSGTRHERACHLLSEAAPGTIDGDWMRRALADHGTEPAICRHAADSAGTRTAFWTVADVTAGDIRFGRGRPCDDAEAQRYVFA